MAATRLPAWKRLGLQLKNQQTPSQPVARDSSTDEHQGVQPSHTRGSPKASKDSIKPEDETQHVQFGVLGSRSLHNGANVEEPVRGNRRRQEDVDSISAADVNAGASKRRKSVAFASDTKSAGQGPEASSVPGPILKSSESSTAASNHGNVQARKVVPRASASSTKRENQQTSQSAYLDYLQQHHTARDRWKFNKNKQGTLLKHAFDLDKVPPEHGEALGEYIEGLQGVRPREQLRDTATDTLKELSTAESEEEGGADMADVESKAREQWRAEALLEQLKATKRRLRDAETANKDKSDALRSRLRRRQRAEEILLALARSGPPPGFASSQSHTASTSGQAQHIRFDDEVEEQTSGANKKPPQATKRTTRKSKIRTGVPDDDTSSDSDTADSTLEEVARTAGEGPASSSDSSDSDSDSDSSKESSSEASSSSSGASSSEADSEDAEESAVEIPLGPERGPQLNKSAIRELIHKQNGARDPSKKRGLAPVATPGRKKRAFDASSFGRS